MGRHLHQRDHELAVRQPLLQLEALQPHQLHLDAQLRLPDLLELLGRLGLGRCPVICQRHRVQRAEAHGVAVPRLPQQRQRTLTPLLVLVRIVVDPCAVDHAELLPAGGKDAVGHQSLRRRVVLPHGLRHRIAVDDQAQRPPQLTAAHAGGHLVQQQDAHRGVAALLGVLPAGPDDDIHLSGTGVRRLPVLQLDVDAIRPQPLHVVVRRTGVQRQPRTVAPVAGALVGAVAHEPQTADAPVFVARHRLLLHRHGDCRRAGALDERRVAAAEHHHQRVVVRRRHLQRLGIAQHRLVVPRHHGQCIGVGAVGLRVHQTPPGVHEVAGRNGAAVGPFRVGTQLERIRHCAVQRRLLGVAAGHGVNRALGAGPHQVLKHMLDHGALRRRHCLSGVHRPHRAGHHHRQLLLIVGLL